MNINGNHSIGKTFHIQTLNAIATCIWRQHQLLRS